MTTLADLRPAIRAALPGRQFGRWVAAVIVTGTAFGVGLVFVGSPVATILGVLGLIALAVSLARAHAATYLVIAILYSNAAAVAVHHGLPDIVGLAFPLILALPLGDELLLRRKPVTITSGLPFLFGYMVIEALGEVGARSPSDGLDSLITFLISGFVLYFVITNVVRSFSTLQRAVWIILIVTGALGALSSYQMITRTYGNDYWGFSTVNLPGNQDQLVAGLQGTPRAEGPIAEKNRYGQIMLVMVPIGAFLAWSEKRRSARAAAVVLTLLTLGGMATSFSRGAAVALFAAFTLAAVLRYVKPIHLVAALAAIVLMLVAFPRYQERLSALQALFQLDRNQAGASTVEGDVSNLRGRETTSLTGLLLWADHPIIGVGRGQFDLYYVEYAKLVADTGVDVHIDVSLLRPPHNLFTGQLAETGTLGFIFFIGVFAVTLRDLYRVRRRWLLARPEVALLATGFFLALVAYLVSGIALHLNYERYVWLLLALAGVLAHLGLRGDPARDFEVGRAAPSSIGTVAASPAAAGAGAS